ncbi:MAG TPA: PAS domain-containing protein [Alphaproteobacteria bacterium]|jgi:hypothetical protein|nr:PAS domain-containing protein [Alphaproteobacteria bacterium]
MTPTTGVSHEEQRLVLRLMVHWRALAGDRDMPVFADFDPAVVPDIWADSFLVDARTSPGLVFHALGLHHVDALGRDVSGQRVTTAGHNTLLGRALSYADKVLERRVPISLGGQFVDNEGRMRLYRSILLPLEHDGGLALLGAANSRIVVVD